MAFADVLDSYRDFDVAEHLASADARGVEEVLGKARPTALDLLTLLSEAAGGMLEPMAQRAHEVTRRHFGNVVQLFTPLYISNYCDNACRYCSFSKRNSISRRHLTAADIRAEAERIGATGMRHVLLLTGESRTKASPEYIREAVAVCREFFASISIEVYPLSESEYGGMVAAGVDGLTLYQEVYDRDTYARLHEGGPKADYDFRLDAPERACRANIHAVSLGPLLGLAESCREAFSAALHLEYLQRRYPATEVSVSLPRMRPLVADFAVEHAVNDRLFVQMLTAFRICFPTAGITMSTRESGVFRDAVLPMGVTRMSAGVSTAVGGRATPGSTTQFEISDTRDVARMKADLLRMGYQPVMHDWHHSLLSEAGA
jgi:2-iminoacetate synthase